MSKYIISNAKLMGVTNYYDHGEVRSELIFDAYMDEYGVVYEEHDYGYDEATRTDSIEKVIFNGPCTIIIGGGRKTIVKTQDGEKYDRKKGFYMCLLKHSVSSKEYTDILEGLHNKPGVEKRVAKSMLTYIYGKKRFNKLVEKYLK